MNKLGNNPVGLENKHIIYLVFFQQLLTFTTTPWNSALNHPPWDSCQLQVDTLTYS